MRVELSGPADAGLHLVEDEQRAVARGDLPRLGEVVERRHHHAALPHHRLEEHRGGVVVDRGLERGGVTVGHVHHARGHRLERRALGRLPGERERAHGAAVERLLAGDDLGPAGQPRDLERRLVRLGPRIAEERASGMPVVGGAVAEMREQPFRQFDDRLVRIDIRDMAERAQLLGDRGEDRRMGVAETVDRDAAEEIDIAVTVRVVDHRTRATHQRQLRGAVVVHHRGGPPLLEFLVFAHCFVPSGEPAPAGAGVTIVPIPSPVNSSSSTECGMRPSMTWAVGTPPCTARKQASILGTMPASSRGSNSASAAVSIRVISDERSGHSVYRPSTSVSTTSFSAPIPSASAAAAVSALMLCTTPSASGAMVETTGMRPASIRSSTASGFTSLTSPTRPISVGTPSTSTVRRVAVNRPASSPEMPTAYGPCALISPTSSRPTCPNSTIRTTSITSGVVTRKPPRNSPCRPSFFSIALICGPPPCTTTGCTPTVRRKAMSAAKACSSSASTMALPPNFTTTILSRNFCNQGSASASTCALSSAESSWCSWPVMSCRPNSLRRTRARGRWCG
ncbi:ion transporter [Nocardia brasiliensis ATCC 700358]|uniref:Ion transporter n=1 Tax=Nocardia brasiliensis (strain ATCC 700358 / HUJEG-1) TaxID=1133849 RepID=K0EUV5_NOCB7|nr:ion transporter [Nocardia brasiliensis ATCC 700358]